MQVSRSLYTCFRFLMYSFSLDRLLSKAPSDEMGSVTHVVEEEDRRVRNCYGYDAFGNTEYAEETVRNRFRYTGQQYDSVTGQYYLRARYYNPVIGRFLQEDTYYGDGLNLYAYCRNNPVRYYDPSGHDACPKALQDQMKGQGIPDVEIAQNVERIQALIADEKLSIEDAYKQVTGRDYPGGGGNVAKGSSGADGATYEGTIYRNVNSQYDPLEMNDYTINSNHRYTKPGTPGLYFSSGEKIVYAELGNYNVDDFSNRTTYSYDVTLNNMLDVSNPKTRDQLGISLGDITGNNYDVTQSIGDYAYSNGYNGIIAPSARADGGVNVIVFDTNNIKK